MKLALADTFPSVLGVEPNIDDKRLNNVGEGGVCIRELRDDS